MKICLKYMEIVCIQRNFCYNSKNFHAMPLIRGGVEMEEKGVHAIKEHREQPSLLWGGLHSKARPLLFIFWLKTRLGK